MLSDTEIRAELGKDIVIHPFSEKQLGPNSYDIRLGEWFYRENRPPAARFHPNAPPAPLHIHDEKEVEAAWLLVQASVEKTGIYAGKRVLWLWPGERVLGHSMEFIGGRGRITTMIKSRSSIGRSGVSTCLCAGAGDVGYVNAWTLEITNHLQYHRLPLIVGEPVAQMLFFRTGECSKPYTGKYQLSGCTVDELQACWRPEMMLPRLHLDAAKWGSTPASKEKSESACVPIEAAPNMPAVSTSVAGAISLLKETVSLLSSTDDGKQLTDSHADGNRVNVTIAAGPPATNVSASSASAPVAGAVASAAKAPTIGGAPAVETGVIVLSRRRDLLDGWIIDCRSCHSVLWARTPHLMFLGSATCPWFGIDCPTCGTLVLGPFTADNYLRVHCTADLITASYARGDVFGAAETQKKD